MHNLYHVSTEQNNESQSMKTTSQQWPIMLVNVITYTLSMFYQDAIHFFQGYITII